MTVTAYAMVSQVRYRELKTRIALAAFIGCTAWFVVPSIWPMVWFAAVLATQAFDWAVFSRFRRNTAWEPDRAYLVLCCATTVLSVAVYAAMTAFMWFNGGEVGRLFAMVQCAGGLLHVSLHMHHARPILISAVAPHATYFFGLPVFGAISSQNWHELLIAIGCVLYMSHLVVAVRQSSSTTGALQSARDAEQSARRKAEVASAAKSDFLAVVSHEIRMSMLIDAGDVLMGLLNDVLDFSKIEAGKMELESADMIVRDRLSTVVRLWEPRALANGVRLKVRIAPDVPSAVRTDPLRVQQILFNLMSNAVKFTHDGEIRIAVSWADGRLNVAVTDTGCGIPADRLGQIFNSFEQADVGTTRRYGGTGLGLSISRKLAELMGGSLTVESIDGEGSTFVLSLPVTATENAMVQPVRPVETSGSLAGRSILAADDHEVNRRILQLLLEPHGCRLTLVENGAEALEAASGQRFDAILMDMQMPVMDGLEATRRIRAGQINGDTPVIALTANAMDVHRAAWDAAGVHAFLTKPIDPVTLATTLAEACVMERPEAESAVA
jgi:signal transduction histidine kinase/CheY-like chemotaxis protein